MSCAGAAALRNPVLVAGFEGWNDAGEAASFAARFLSERWDAEPFAEIDPEEFFDFTATRPQVRLDEGMQREIVWPATTMSCSRTSRASRTRRHLPHRHRAAAAVADLLRGDRRASRASTTSRLVVTLGALLAEVPHSRPVNVVGTDAGRRARAIARPAAVRRTKDRPGIVGVLHDAFRRAGVPSVSLWAAVPTYVPSAPSPKAALALDRAARRRSSARR